MTLRAVSAEIYRNRAKRVKHPNKPYSFEVIKIKLLDFIESNSSISIANGPNSQGGLSINIANVLQNIEITILMN